MFQNFAPPEKPDIKDDRLGRIRALLNNEKLDAVIVPHSDEQRNEYLPACHERLAWISGFTGSAGAAAITRDRAILFVDGRYTVQVTEQVDQDVFEICPIAQTPTTTKMRHLSAAKAVMTNFPASESVRTIPYQRLSRCVASDFATMQILRTNVALLMRPPDRCRCRWRRRQRRGRRPRVRFPHSRSRLS